MLAHLNYPLVQRALRLLRAEVWRTGGAGRLHRVTARLIPGHLADTPIVVAHARLVMTGALGHRLHEEVLEVGGEIREGRFSRIRSVGKVRALLRAAGDELPPPDVLARLQAVWPNIEPSLQRTLEVRGRERTDSLRKKLADRAQKEAGDIEAILLELQRTIERELSDPEPVQLSLFSPTEREQYSRNQNALRAPSAKNPPGNRTGDRGHPSPLRRPRTPPFPRRRHFPRSQRSKMTHVKPPLGDHSPGCKSASLRG